jgi:tetratricopeptide (TPR) repeat protein
MKTIDFSYFIERFLSGDMDEAEKEWFLKEIDGNPELRREVDLRRKTDKVLMNQDIMNLRKKLNEIESKSRRNAEVIGARHGRIKYAAAVAVFLIAGGIGLYTTRTKLSSNEILERYYTTYETTVSTRSDISSNNQDFNLALEYYKIHDYKNAAVLFSKVINKEPGNMHSTFLNGVSNFEISNYPEAKSSFSKVIDDDNNLFIDHAEWYLSLCYIKTEEPLKAKEQLEKIVKTGSIYKKDAKQILRRLK